MMQLRNVFYALGMWTERLYRFHAWQSAMLFTMIFVRIHLSLLSPVVWMFNAHATRLDP